MADNTLLSKQTYGFAICHLIIEGILPIDNGQCESRGYCVASAETNGRLWFDE